MKRKTPPGIVEQGVGERIARDRIRVPGGQRADDGAVGGSFHDSRRAECEIARRLVHLEALLIDLPDSGLIGVPRDDPASIVQGRDDGPNPITGYIGIDQHFRVGCRPSELVERLLINAATVRIAR